jgi:diguanylate cyclase (GGDEF)-like protein
MYAPPNQGQNSDQDSTPLRTEAYAGANARMLYPAEFINTLQTMVQTHTDNSQSGALLLVSIDNLAMILNGYGHDVAETVLQSLMGMTRQMLRADDYIERVQRDQFAIILSNSYPEDTDRTARRVTSVIQNYGRDSYATASLHIIGTIGAVHFPEESNDATDALDKAYVALHSTQQGTYRGWANTQHQADLCRQQMGLASYLYRAYQEKRLRLAWQPVIESTTGHVVHYEALLRMIGHGGKITSAGALIPVAEQMGLIEEIDAMVLDMVVQELRNSTDVTLALNVSNLTTDSQTWLDHLNALVEETPEIAPRLIVEITETAAQRDLRRVAYFVASIQSLGAQVALDDFGSGYTSFRQLKALSVDMVKIDGVFIKDIAHNADNRFFVRTLLDFIRGFGLQSVAEFVENGEIAKILMEMGVDLMQGYYFGKPDNHRRWLNHGEYRQD